MGFAAEKSFRLLNMYERLNKGERLYKQSLADAYGVSLKTVQRDMDDLRAYIAELHGDEAEMTLTYDRAGNCYTLVRQEREWMTNEEALALCKILLESRAFPKQELSRLVEKLIAQIAPADRAVAEELIRNEMFNYIPPHHGKALLAPIWELSRYIVAHQMIAFDYTRQDGKKSRRVMKPVGILFSEFYFYCIAFDGADKTDYPIVFRIDRMEHVEPTGERFAVPYKDRFQDGEFRKRIQFMYMGPLRRVTFEYTGVLEAMLDKVPTAKVIAQKDGVYTITAESYGDGILMWLGAQGNKVQNIRS
ncbi:MAG: WYL domain-containing protein [Oscillospiraceae bacterium]|nr:WYL domain-containing protein [Oscillospiraceae bacterium]